MTGATGNHFAVGISDRDFAKWRVNVTDGEDPLMALRFAKRNILQNIRLPAFEVTSRIA